MESKYSVDFNIDRKSKVIRVEKTYAVPLEKVWRAWTNGEVLDQWWAPKPWKAVTKAMDFREGGQWLYSMEGPDGEKHWSKSVYKSINNLSSFEAIDTFCDENGNNDPTFAASYWYVSFKTIDTKTLVAINIRFETSADLEEILEMGFKEGFEAGLGNLEKYLK